MRWLWFDEMSVEAEAPSASWQNVEHMESNNGPMLVKYEWRRLSEFDTPINGLSVTN